MVVPGNRLLEAADRLFEQDALAVLEEYVAIPCLSPDFDAEWEAHGYIEAATQLLAGWARSRPLPGLTVEVAKLPGLTPVILAEVPATAGYAGGGQGSAGGGSAGGGSAGARDDGSAGGGDNGSAGGGSAGGGDGSAGGGDSSGAAGVTDAGPVLLYGHLDKQPPLGAWREGLDPYVAVRDGDHLYGRGTADDGYSIFAALGSLQALHESSLAHGRCIVLIEASEESGSPHLGAYLEALGPRLGPNGPVLVVCLDSGCPTYDRLWATTSLRGLLSAEIRVDVLTEGVHSGAAGGVVPSSFRILRRLLDRIEDADTGDVLVEECAAVVPGVRRAEAEALVASLGEGAVDAFPTVPGLRLGGRDAVERVLRRTWSASVAFVGVDGVPSLRDGGNVLRPFTTGKIAMRLPPSVDAEAAAKRVADVLRSDPPDGARVTVVAEGARGFDAPEMAPWLSEAVADASTAYFGQPVGAAGEGGTIPFLSTLQQRYPSAQFLVTGVLGPESNAHGPNEILHLPTAKRVTASVAHVLSQTPQ
jgi:acetylornithine deacetylase/succinyl-diaminopimelate desuccinylase-like protein